MNEKGGRMNMNQMNQEREAKILEGAIAKWGAEAQITKAIEELGELTVELARYMNGLGNTDAIREEMADAFIMLNQLELLFGDVTEVEIYKLERLEGRLSNCNRPEDDDT
jgi:NTP pyrophosphatase (non-canonical NTP hydrolase)